MYAPPLRFVLLGLALLVGPVHAAPEMAAFSAAQQSFIHASQGDTSATETALAQFEHLLANDPAHPLLHVYHGAAFSLQARDSLLPWRKMRYADDGLAEIDRALASLRPEHETEQVRGVPVAAESRFVAASTFSALPEMFHRADAGRRQLAQVLNAPGFDTWPEGFRASVLMKAAELARKDAKPADEARYLKRVAGYAVPQAALARTRLKELGL